MVLLGIILLLLGVAVGVVSVVAAQSSTATVHVEALGLQRDAHALELFIAGAVAVLLFCIGWAILAARARRRARIRRDERERERLADVERAAEAERTEHERRIEEGGLRHEDLQRREDALLERENAVTAREQEVARLEGHYGQGARPSATEGNVAEGTAEWADETDTRDQGRP